MVAESTRTKRKKALESLSQTLNDAYGIEMMRIKRNSKHYEVAKRALSWIYFAKQSFHMAELQEALSIEMVEDTGDDCADLDLDNFEKPQFILDCCGSLILWDRLTDVVGFSHYTVSEFFNSNAAGNIEPELYIARTCLTYLGFREFEKPCNGHESLLVRTKKYKFATYAGEFWGVHTKHKMQNDDDVQRLVFMDFGIELRRRAIFQFSRQPAIHITARHGLTKICAFLLDQGELGNGYIVSMGIFNCKQIEGSRSSDCNGKR